MSSSRTTGLSPAGGKDSRVLLVAQSEAAVLAATPRVQAAVTAEGEDVGGPHGKCDHVGCQQLLCGTDRAVRRAIRPAAI